MLRFNAIIHNVNKTLNIWKTKKNTKVTNAKNAENVLVGWVDLLNG